MSDLTAASSTHKKKLLFQVIHLTCMYSEVCVILGEWYRFVFAICLPVLHVSPLPSPALEVLHHQHGCNTSSAGEGRGLVHETILHVCISQLGQLSYVVVYG